MEDVKGGGLAAAIYVAGWPKTYYVLEFSREQACSELGDQDRDFQVY